MLPYANTGFATAEDFPFKRPEDMQQEKFSGVDFGAINAEFSSPPKGGWREHSEKVKEKKPLNQEARKEEVDEEKQQKSVSENKVEKEAK